MWLAREMIKKNNKESWYEVCLWKAFKWQAGKFGHHSMVINIIKKNGNMKFVF